MLRVLILLSLTSLSIVVASPARADKRVALVIGNAAYTTANPLANPTNDAGDISASLRQLGFEVVLGLDLDKGAFDAKVREFARALDGAETGLLFYAGHGLQVAGQNYLVPVDAKLESERDLDFEAVRLDFILKQMELGREDKTNIVFLDACRDNPLARNLARSMGTRSASIGKGLAQVQTGVGTFISYSTQPGNVAVDGKGAELSVHGGTRQACHSARPQPHGHHDRRAQGCDFLDGRPTGAMGSLGPDRGFLLRGCQSRGWAGGSGIEGAGGARHQARGRTQTKVGGRERCVLGRAHAVEAARAPARG